MSRDPKETALVPVAPAVKLVPYHGPAPAAQDCPVIDEPPKIYVRSADLKVAVASVAVGYLLGSLLGNLLAGSRPMPKRQPNPNQIDWTNLAPFLTPRTDGAGFPSQPPAQRESETSVEAAALVKPIVGTLRRKLYDWLVAHGAATDEEMQDGIPMKASTQRPRRIELCAAGLCRDTNTTRKTAAGREAVVWKAVEV